MDRTMKILLKICLSAALSLGITTLASAVTTYKWVDKDGTVHYSQEPPSNDNYQTLNVQTQSPSGDSSSSQQSAPSYSTPSSSNDSKATDVIKKQEAMGEAQRQKNCETAKKNLEIYTTYRRFREKSGKVIRMDDNERAKRIEQSKEQIKQFCQ